MSKRGWMILMTAVAWMAASATAQQQAPERATATQQTQSQRMYGSELLSEQERNAYRTQMNAANSEQERERIRSEHRELVQRRANERGVDATGMAYGPGPGAGPGKGSGGSAGKGR